MALRAILALIYEGRERDERSVEELVQALCAIASAEVIELDVLLEKRDELQTWLSRLSSIGDFREDSSKRQELAKFIVQSMEKANSDAGFREVFLSCINEADRTCGDRMALSLLYLDLNHQISESKANLGELARLLGRGSWALEMLAEIAQAKMKTLRLVDEIEVYLAYPIMLKERLKLPIMLDSMLYFGCSGVSPRDLDEAAKVVGARLANREEYANRLTTDNTWQEALKSHSTTSVRYQQLERARERAGEEEEYEEAAAAFKKGLLLLTEQVLATTTLFS